MTGIYQVYFNDISRANLDPAFIPYHNTRKNQFFENSVILDLWEQGKYFIWDRMGVLSWRYHQKTGITGKVLMQMVNTFEVDMFNLSPHGYDREEHPYSRKRFPPAVEFAWMIDERNILPFTLKGYDTEGLNIWCNYWIMKSEWFDRFCRYYLNPLVDYLKNPDPELKTFMGKPVGHRPDDVLYTVVPFFLEGLASVFAHREGLKIQRI